MVERLDRLFSGDGEHLYLQVLKKNQNTRAVASELARLFGIAEQDVGYGGLKDRRAVATQWFSLRLPGQWPNVRPGKLKLPDCQIIQVERHRRKLRRGDHSGNSFSIILRNLDGDTELLEQRLKMIRERGVPNYFGTQRFGRNGNNLIEADRILNQARVRKTGNPNWGLYISAARSYLFNHILSSRIANDTWAIALDGETEPGGPLWGRGRAVAGRDLAEFEADVLEPYRIWCHGLEHCGLSQDRRALVLKPLNMHWHRRSGKLQLGFALPPGAYATSVLREMVLTGKAG